MINIKQISINSYNYKSLENSATCSVVDFAFAPEANQRNNSMSLENKIECILE
jgi:hypothetical protein